MTHTRPVFIPDPALCKALGSTAREVADYVDRCMKPTMLSQDGGYRRPMVLLLPAVSESDRQHDAQGLMEMSFRTRTGATVPLSEIGEVRTEPSFSTLLRVDRSPACILRIVPAQIDVATLRRRLTGNSLLDAADDGTTVRVR